jgi:hypothetical protein
LNPDNAGIRQSIRNILISQSTMNITQTGFDL